MPRIRSIAVILCFAAAAFLLAEPARTAVWNDDRETVINRVTQARDKAETLRQEMRKGANQISMRVQAALDDAAADLTRALDEHTDLDERDPWLAPNDCGVGSACDDFRDDLLELVTTIEDLSSSVIGLTPATMEVEFGALRSVIENAPGKALWPLNVAMSREASLLGPGGNTVVLMQDASDDLVAIRDVLDGDCPETEDEREDLSVRARRLQELSHFLKFAGSALEASGEKEVKGQAAIWGWLGIEVKANKVKAVGKYVGALGSVIGDAATRVSGRAGGCERARLHDELLDELETLDDGHKALLLQILANQEAILEGQQEILDAIENVGPPWGSQAKGHGRP